MKFSHLILTFIFSIFPVIGSAEDCLIFLPAGRNLFFWDELESGVRGEAKKNGWNVITKGTNSELQEEQQVYLYDDLKKFKCDGLIIAPNSKKIEQMVEKDNFYKYVYLVDRSMSEKKKFALIATDNFRAGREAGQKFVSMLTKNDKVIIFRLDKNVTTTVEREKGLIAELDKAKIKIIHQEYMGLDQGIVRNNILKVLKQFKGKYQGVFVSNELLANALIANIKLLQKEKNNYFAGVQFITFDTNQNIDQALKDGFIDATFVQNPRKMGEESVKLLIKSFKEKNYINFNIDTGIQLKVK